MYALLTSPEILKDGIYKSYSGNYWVLIQIPINGCDNLCITPDFIPQDMRLFLMPNMVYIRLKPSNYKYLSYLDYQSEVFLFEEFNFKLTKGFAATKGLLYSDITNNLNEIIDSYYSPRAIEQFKDLQEIRNQLESCKSFDTLKLFLLMALPYLHQYDISTIVDFISKYNVMCKEIILETGNLRPHFK